MTSSFSSFFNGSPSWLFALGLSLWESSQGLTLFGRENGFRLWCPGIGLPCTSQSLFDPYSITHIEHGLLYWAALTSGFPSLTETTKLNISFAIETSWEAAENSTWGINRYRNRGWTTYGGDSIMNSLSDVACMAFGFYMASEFIREPLAAVTTAALLDATLYLAYGDNLLQNVLLFFGIL